MTPGLFALLSILVVLAGVGASVAIVPLRRNLPLLITFLVGSVMVASVFIPHAPFDEADDKFSIFFNIIAAIAFILGGLNLLKIHGEKISRRAHHWQYNLVTVVAFLLMLGAGFWSLAFPGTWKGSVQSPGTFFNWMYQSTFSPLQSTMFSLLAFFVASASYRAFRAKTKEASLLLGAATIILLGRTPLGHYLTFWLPDPLQMLHIPTLSGWILGVPNLAGQRAILIGIALGIISTSLKIILGIERSYLGAKDS
ncbi:MAG TPA: hypothetical protein VF720_15225 [Candidatus Eisenbacteria bacterium]